MACEQFKTHAYSWFDNLQAVKLFRGLIVTRGSTSQTEIPTSSKQQKGLCLILVQPKIIHLNIFP